MCNLISDNLYMKLYSIKSKFKRKYFFLNFRKILITFHSKTVQAAEKSFKAIIDMAWKVMRLFK